MSNQTIEAILKISSKLGSMTALNTLQKKLNDIDRSAKNYNRTQSMMGQLNASAASGVGILSARYLAPGALAYGAGRALTSYADLERQLTRTGIKLNATREEMSGLYDGARRAAREVGLLTSDVIGTIDAYAETGATLTDITTDLKTLTAAQQALGAEGRDVVNVWDTAKKSLNLAAKDADRFFGAIGAGGAAGKFEGSDMAQFFPSLLPVAAAAGFKGIEGVDRLVAFAEVMRDFTGTSGEAATAMTDFLAKIDSPDVQRNFAKFGIDLEKRLKSARENGEDILKVMHEVMMAATKGDPTMLTKLFGDKEARAGARVILQWLDEIYRKQKQIEAAAPTVIADNNKRLIEDTRTQLDKLSDSWDEFVKKTGQTIAPLAVPLLDTINDATDKDAAIRAGLNKRGVKGRSAQEMWLLLHGRSLDVQNSLAVDGGYNMNKQMLPELAYPAPLPNLADLPSADVPLPMRRPARPGEAGYVAPNTPPLSSFGGDRPMSAFDQDAAENADMIKTAIQQSGASAGDAMQTGIEQGGSSVSDALRQAGDYIAARILNAVSNITVNVGGVPGRVNADVGRAGVEREHGVSGGDILAVP